MNRPFSPGAASGVTRAVTTSSASVALNGTGDVVCVSNLGTNKAFIELGASTVTAAVTTGFCVLPSTQVLLSKGSATHLAAISAATESATLYISTGYGDTLR